MNILTATFLRGFFKILGGLMVGAGVMDAATADAIENELSAIIDGAVVVVGAGLAIGASVASYRAKMVESAEAKKIAAAVIAADVPIGAEIAQAKAAKAAALGK